MSGPLFQIFSRIGLRERINPSVPERGLKSFRGPCRFHNRQDLKSFTPRIIINRGKTETDIRVGEKLRQIVSRNLDIKVEFVGLVPESPELVPSLFKGVPAGCSES